LWRYYSQKRKIRIKNIKLLIMKKIIFTSVLIIQSLLFLAQSMGNGKSVIYIGAGAGNGAFGSAQYRGSGYVYRSSPTIHLGFEHGISEAIPQSIVGLGGSVSMWFGSRNYSDRFGHEWHKSWSDVTTLVKGYYHHKFLVGEKWDVYGGAMIGVKYRSYSFTSNDQYYVYENSNETGAYFAGGIAVGGRYYVSKSFGFYAEAGTGVNVDYIQAGFAFKF
jgi:hypothetical protein